MKLCSFSVKNSYPFFERLGALVDDQIVDLAASYRSYLRQYTDVDQNRVFDIANILLPSDMTKFLEGGTYSMEAAKKAVEFSKEALPTNDYEKIIYSKDEIKIHAPIKNPPTIRDFLSFEEHFRNSLNASISVDDSKNGTVSLGGTVPKVWYERPIYYKTVASTIIGTEEECVWPAYSKVRDYELEFACVIGKRAENVTASEASNYIAGFLIYNDFTARDTQLSEMEGRLGPAKGKDFCTAMGPYLVTVDEIENVYNLSMTARVNGEVWSQGSTSTMYRTFEDIIEYVSQSEPLVPGDILGSGTVGRGCGLELGKFLNDGDIIELEVEGLGVLRNQIRVNERG
ncbi:2-hydroxyhepta-2,4-diene-1,7-dioate isomerase [Lysinibacillus sp. PLM2]|nr:2-hydroxyhepta-2,4-diene-1,7-dioate isomerase [Lysinibacillus sp. PLM2]